MNFHEAANIFPLDEEHLGELAADIRANGQRVPIETLGGEILDGRRRFLACQRAGVKPQFRAVSVDDPVAYVISLNLHRRHLTPSQLAVVGAKAREYYDRLAKERMSEGGKIAGKGRPQQGKENLPDPIPDAGQARDQAGEAVGVSGRLIDYATKVLEKGTPELVKAVEEGRMAVSTAAILASEPEAVQRDEVSKPKRNRRYGPGGGGSIPAAPPACDSEAQPARIRTVALEHGYEAINCLKRIPVNDPQRARAFQLVKDFIRTTSREV